MSSNRAWTVLGGYLVALALLGGLAACQGSRNDFSRVDDTKIFRPPTRAVTPTSQKIESMTSPIPESLSENPEITPQATPVCTNQLAFIKDETLPDGSRVTPGTALDKRWRIENSGTCNWDARYRLQLLAGPELGIAKELDLYPARSGSQATIRIVFNAPAETGAYRSAWQAIDPDGNSFGDPIFIEFAVVAATQTP